MEMFCLDRRTEKPIRRWGLTSRWRSSPDTCRQRSSGPTTFDMEVKGNGGPGAAGNSTQAPCPVGWTDACMRQLPPDAGCSAAPRYVLTHKYKPATLSFSLSIWARTKCPLRTCASLVFGVDFLVEEVLCQQVELAVLFSDSMRPDKLELLQCKLVEFVLHLPDGRLLQPGDRLLRGRLLLAGLSQVGFLPCDERGGGLKWSQRFSINIHI